MTDAPQPQPTVTASTPILTGKLSVQIENFPNHPPGRDYCFVWTKQDGTRVVFGCDSQDNCQKMLPHWQERARAAELNGSEAL